MSTNSTQDVDPREHAEQWFARLRAVDCSARERTAFEHWRAASPANAAAYREVDTLWQRLQTVRADPAIAAATAALRAAAPDVATQTQATARPVAAPRYQARRRAWIPVAIAAALVLAVVPLLLPQINGSQRYATDTGEQRNIALADGSTVLLDAQSTLQVRYDKQQRHLRLQRGQAQFKVAHDAQRPFIVEAGDGRVKALGTQFQVRVDGPAVTVTLLEGKVSVDAPKTLDVAKTETLTAGQQIRYDSKKDLWAKAPADLEVVQAWVYGDLVFKRWRLADLVTEMNRHSTVKLTIADPSLADLPVSGRFHAGDHQSLILALESDWPIATRKVSSEEVALLRR
jgi:transmembrane sensor